MSRKKDALRHGDDLIAAVLSRWDLATDFTPRRGHISPIVVGARDAGLRVVDCRGERSAVFRDPTFGDVRRRLGSWSIRKSRDISGHPPRHPRARRVGFPCLVAAWRPHVGLKFVAFFVLFLRPPPRRTRAG